MEFKVIKCTLCGEVVGEPGREEYIYHRCPTKHFIRQEYNKKCWYIDTVLSENAKNGTCPDCGFPLDGYEGLCPLCAVRNRDKCMEEWSEFLDNIDKEREE